MATVSPSRRKSRGVWILLSPSINRLLLTDVLDSFHRLAARCDIVIAEGAGSPAEINLRAGDIANMGFARVVNMPVVLVGGIDRGGVIAAIAGTKSVLDPADAAMIRGFIINKFRGDPVLFEDGYRAIERLTGWRGFGMVPWLVAARHLPSEDAVVLDRALGEATGRKLVACPILPHIANFDDLERLCRPAKAGFQPCRSRRLPGRFPPFPALHAA